MKNFSLAFLTILDIDLLEAIEIAADVGFDSIGLRLLPVTSSEGDYAIYKENFFLHDVIGALSRTGLKVCDIELIWLKPETNINQFNTFFDRSKLLEAKFVTVIIDDPDEVRYLDNFCRLCDKAAQFNITLNVEPISWVYLSTINQAYDLVLKSKKLNSGITLDALHFYRSENKLSDLTLSVLERINILQLSDAPSKFDNNLSSIRNFARLSRLLPGKGDLDLKSLIGLMPERVIISPEIPNQVMSKGLSPRERIALAYKSSYDICRFTK